MNKKAFIAEALVDFYSYIAFILIIIVFFLLFSIQKCSGPSEREIISSFEENNAEIILLNYLRTPILVEGKELNFAELITLISIDKEKYKNIFYQETEKFFRNLDFIKGWQIKIIEEKKPILHVIRGSDCKEYEETMPSSKGTLKVIFYECEKSLGAIGPTSL